MKSNGVKIIAFAVAGMITFSGICIDVNATKTSTILPVAGLDLALNEGSSAEELKQKVESEEAAAADTVAGTDSSLQLSAGEESIASTNAETMTQEATTEEATTEEATTEEATTEEETTTEEEDFSGLVIAKVDDYVNVRDIPSEDGEVLGKLYDKSVGEFVAKKDGWYQITSGNVTGWVKAEYVVTGDAAVALAKEVGNRIATVTTTTLKVREEPSKDAAVLGLVPIEDELSVLDENDDWIKVSIEEGEGYVSTEFVSLSTEFVKAESKAEEEARLQKEENEREAAQSAAAKATSKSSSSSSSSSSSAAVSSGGGAASGVASYACQFVGNPYVYGGSSLTNGTDCSGFVMSVYANYGVGLPHSSGALRSVGSDVGGLANAQPGDIVCYSGHVGIYIGGGNIVHASTAATGIKISNASYRDILSVRRIF